MIQKSEMLCCAAILRRIIYHENAPLPEMDGAAMRRIIECQDMNSLVDCCKNPALAFLREPQNAVLYIVYRYDLYNTTLSLFQEMAKRRITGAVLKGEALNLCYPSEAVRISGDIDLYIPGNQGKAFQEAAEALGFHLEQDAHHSQIGVDEYRAENGIHLEAQHVYFQMMSARQRRLLKEKGYFSTDCFRQEEGFTVLKPEEHLVYLIYHAARHLMGQSITMRMLLDIALYVNRYADEIDAGSFSRTIRQLRLTRIANAILCFCEKYLGMKSGFWKKTGPRMENLLRMELNCPPKDKRRRNWERFLRRSHPSFYQQACEADDQEYRIKQRFLWKRLFRSKVYFSTFITWLLLHAVWGVEIDFSGQAV